MPDEPSEKDEPKVEPPTEGEPPAGDPPKPEGTPAEIKTAAADAAEEDDDEDDAGEEDAFRPEAIAKRIEKLGSDDEADKIAREEEQKLAERRRAAKKKGKRGLESAASKRLAKIGDKPVKRVASAVPAEGDPLLDKTAKVSDWLRDHGKLVGFAVLGLVVVAVGVGGYTWRQQTREMEASVLLADAVNDERGVIGDPDKDEKKRDPRPVFKTADERRVAALAKYKEVESKYAGTGAAILARLDEGSIDLDIHDTDAALAAFNDVRGSALAGADAYVRGRAIEGVGFAYELLAVMKQDAKSKWLDEAQKTFGELEKVDAPGFKELAMYHEARVMEAKGDKPGAIDLLKNLQKKLADQKKPDEPDAFPYLDTAVSDRLAALDPTAVPRKPPRGGLGGGLGGALGGGAGGIEDLLGPDGKIDINDPRVQALIKQQMGSMPPAPAKP